MNMFKKKDGFTLVELIVVIAILAILAGVAVPAYTGYLTKAKDAAVVSELAAVLTAAQADNATGTLTAVKVTPDGLYINDSTTPDEEALEPFYTQESIDALQAKMAGTSYANGAKWDPTNGWTAVTGS